MTVVFASVNARSAGRFHDVGELGRRNIDDSVDLAGVEAQPLQLLVHSHRLDDRVEMGQRLVEVVRVPYQHEALPADPFA